MTDQARSLRDIMKARSAHSMQVITVTSGKGGVGKSSVALNLAIAMNKRGRRTLIVDMDLGLANIDVMLGAKTEYDLLSVIQNGRDIRDIIGTGHCGVKFISGGSGVEEMLQLNEISLQRIVYQLMSLEDIADTILFDTGAGISENILRLICASNDTILVATPEPTSFMDAYALVKIISQRNIQPSIQLVINKAETEREAGAALAGFIRISEKYGNVPVKPLGYILNDDHMTRAVKLQVPVMVSFPGSRAAMQFEKLAAQYLQIPISGDIGISAFFRRLKGNA